MAEYPAIPLWTDAYLADTGHLTTLEHGAYLLLLMTIWRAGGSLPDDDKRLSRSARLTLAQWRRIRPTLMEFFTVKDGQISQPRLTDELNAVRQRSKSAANSARAKWRKTKETRDANASETQSVRNATISIEEETNVSSPPLAPPKKSKPAKRATRIPEDWALSPKDIAFAQERGLTDEETQHEHLTFVSWWTGASGKGSTSPDWSAKWRTWILKYLSWREQDPRGPSGGIRRSKADQRSSEIDKFKQSVADKFGTSGPDESSAEIIDLRIGDGYVRQA